MGYKSNCNIKTTQKCIKIDDSASYGLRLLYHCVCKLHCIALYLTNHMGFISHHIMPLVIIINNLGCGHTRMHTYRQSTQDQY